jgi:hypothetical protein
VRVPALPSRGWGLGDRVRVVRGQHTGREFYVIAIGDGRGMIGTPVFGHNIPDTIIYADDVTCVDRSECR